jgi:hypothetical protein
MYLRGFEYGVPDTHKSSLPGMSEQPGMIVTSPGGVAVSSDNQQIKALTEKLDQLDVPSPQEIRKTVRDAIQSDQKMKPEAKAVVQQDIDACNENLLLDIRLKDEPGTLKKAGFRPWYILQFENGEWVDKTDDYNQEFYGAKGPEYQKNLSALKQAAQAGKIHLDAVQVDFKPPSTQRTIAFA